MESKYQEIHTSTFQTFKEYFSDTSDTTQSDTQLSITFPTGNLKGTINYQSTKHANFNNTQEKSEIFFNADLHNAEQDTPILVSGNIDTLYFDESMYFKIRDFALSMGAGSAEVSFINLLAQQLTDKRVSLDQGENL